jgi:hypothetical protein
MRRPLLLLLALAAAALGSPARTEIDRVCQRQEEYKRSNILNKLINRQIAILQKFSYLSDKQFDIYIKNAIQKVESN